MRLSLIINTAAGDPWVARQRNMYRAAAYGQRAVYLQQILDAAAGFDEIILAGSPPSINLKAPEGIRLIRVEVPPRKRDRSDALWQREVGARFSTGSHLVFTHDDHAPGPDFAETLRRTHFEGNLIIPERLHGLTGESLENGKARGYMGGHLLVMERGLWAKVPWYSVDTEYWDVPMTTLWEQAGGKLQWTDLLSCIDLEAGADEA